MYRPARSLVDSSGAMACWVTSADADDTYTASKVTDYCAGLSNICLLAAAQWLGPTLHQDLRGGALSCGARRRSDRLRDRARARQGQRRAAASCAEVVPFCATHAWVSPASARLTLSSLSLTTASPSEILQSSLSHNSTLRVLTAP